MPSKHNCLAVTSSSVLFTLNLLNTQLERLSYYPIQGRLLAY
jgi:hypothetical protein